jgi:hypothetical protein
MVNKKIELPDIEAVSNDRYKEKLKLYIRKKEIMIETYIDGVSQSWKIDKKELRDKL